MGIFSKWDDEVEAVEDTKETAAAPTPQNITVRLTKSFIKLINNVDDLATKNGWNMTVEFPAQGLDLKFKSPNYSFEIPNFQSVADYQNANQIKKDLAKSVTDATSQFALGDYVYMKELSQLQKEHKVIQEEDVRRYIEEGKNIRASIDGFVNDLTKNAPAPQPAKPEPAKKDIPHNTDVIDAINKATAQQKKSSHK